MSKRVRRVIAAVSAVALLGVGIAACANEVSKSPEERIVGMIDQRVESALDDIEATDEQRQRVLELKEQWVEELKEKRKEHESAHAAVEALWLADEVDPEKAHALVDERIDEMRETAHRITDSALELHGLLTSEQRQLLAEQAKERRSRWHRRFHDDEAE